MDELHIEPEATTRELTALLTNPTSPPPTTSQAVLTLKQINSPKGTTASTTVKGSVQHFAGLGFDKFTSAY
jgi:hypothetical protein